jgi:hypothetical protein
VGRRAWRGHARTTCRPLLPWRGRWPGAERRTEGDDDGTVRVPTRLALARLGRPLRGQRGRPSSPSSTFGGVTSSGALSSRRPLNTACRRRPPGVQCPNATSATSFGSTQVASFAPPPGTTGRKGRILAAQRLQLPPDLARGGRVEPDPDAAAIDEPPSSYPAEHERADGLALRPRLEIAATTNSCRLTRFTFSQSRVSPETYGRSPRFETTPRARARSPAAS